MGIICHLLSVLVICRPRANYMMRTVLRKGSSTWNKLPNNIKQVKNTFSLKKSLKIKEFVKLLCLFSDLYTWLTLDFLIQCSTVDVSMRTPERPATTLWNEVPIRNLMTRMCTER